MYSIKDKFGHPQKILKPGKRIVAAGRKKPSNNYSKKECEEACRNLAPAAQEQYRFVGRDGREYFFHPGYSRLVEWGVELPAPEGCPVMETEKELQLEENAPEGMPEEAAETGEAGESEEKYPCLFDEEELYSCIKRVQYLYAICEKRLEILGSVLSNHEKCLNDISHIIELYDMSSQEQLLEACEDQISLLRQRRCVKDEVDTIRLFKRVFGGLDPQEMSNALETLKNRKKRSYHSELIQPERYIRIPEITMDQEEDVDSVSVAAITGFDRL